MKSGSLYFHVPFCNRKCPYCHFYVTANDEAKKARYMRALRAEWEQAAPLLEEYEVVSVYFGGGTPALLGPDRIGEILSWVAAPEVTLEANPENITRAEVAAFAAAGVNRLSIGLQSSDTEQLHRIGREHTGSSALFAVREAAAGGIENISVDLMYDLPGQTRKEWRRTLDETAALPITHLSLYNLTIEPGTAFFRQRKRLQPTLPSEEESASMLLEAVERLEAAGLRRYEISAFARDNKRSIHNIGYWQGRPFIGLGPSAFSYWEGKRTRNIANLAKWAEAVETGQSPIDFEEKLEPEARERELLVIALRMLEGVEVATLSPSIKADLAKGCAKGWLERFGERGYRLSTLGSLFYDELAAELV